MGTRFDRFSPGGTVCFCDVGGYALIESADFGVGGVYFSPSVALFDEWDRVLREVRDEGFAASSWDVMLCGFQENLGEFCICN